MDHDLLVAIKFDQVQDLQKLLPSKNINAVSEKGFGYLHFAMCDTVSFTKIHLVDCLIAAGVDVNVGPNGMKPLFCAVRQNNPALVKALVDAGADCLTFTMEGTDPILHLKKSLPIVERFGISGIKTYEIMKFLLISMAKTIGMAMAPLDLPAYVVFWILELVEPAVKQHEIMVINILQKIRDIRQAKK